MTSLLSRKAKFLPLSIAVIGVFGVTYIAIQQNYRLNANDPQIQMAQEVAVGLENSGNPHVLVPSKAVDIANSLSPFVMIVDDAQNIIASNALLDGNSPSIPSGVFNYTKSLGLHGQDRITWQPKRGVRSAIVVVRTQNGYVVVGRSLKEVESRINTLTIMMSLGLLGTLFLSFLASMFVRNK
jgi:hypothetical protein